MDDARLESAARSVLALAPAITCIEMAANERAMCAVAIERGHFTPEESELLRAWFARYLTARSGLLEVVNELRATAMDVEANDRRCREFAIGYVAVCLLVRAGRFLVADFAAPSMVQRKLNEASEAHRYPRKQYTKIRRSLTHPVNALRLRDVMRFADSHREELDALRGDEIVGPVLAWLVECEDAPRIGTRAYLWGHLRYRWHAWRRRRASAAQQILFSIAEGVGRVIADVSNPFHLDRLTARDHTALTELLEPGDVMVLRHDEALSNLFLPGYWPHVALYVGPVGTLEIAVPEPQRDRWVEPRRVLEARKDGVLLRELRDTLAVDAVAILRPRLDPTHLATAIERVLPDEGKLYNFDFDFFTDDKIVCTEVVYRAFQGLGEIEFTLERRAGRVTLSAEDIVDLARGDRCFDVVAVYGMPGAERKIVTGNEARELLRGQ